MNRAAVLKSVGFEKSMSTRVPSRLGGVVVSVLATGPKDRGFKP
jgi:hypothetical protein